MTEVKKEEKEEAKEDIISNDDCAICPYCGHSCDTKCIEWYWNYVTCDKCGRNFAAKTTKVFQTRKTIRG